MKKIKNIKKIFLLKSAVIGTLPLIPVIAIACGDPSNNNFSLKEIKISNVNTNSVVINIEINNSQNLKTLFLEYSDSSNNKRIAQTSQSNNKFNFNLTNLLANTNYKITKIYFNFDNKTQELNLDDFANKLMFKTLSNKEDKPENPTPPINPIEPIQPKPSPNPIEPKNQEYKLTNITNSNPSFNNLNLLFEFDHSNNTDNVLEITYNGTTRTFNNLVFNGNNLNIVLDNLTANTSYNITSVKLNGQSLDLSKIVNKTFTTTSEPTTAAEDDFAISNVSITNITSNSAVLNVNFSKNQLKNNNQKTFEFSFSNNKIFTTSNYNPGSSSLSINLTNLNSNTLYTLNSIKLNNNALTNIPSSSFTTKEIINNLNATSVNINDITTNSATAVISLNQVISNKNVRLNYRNNSLSSSHFINKTFNNTNNLDFTLSNLQSSNNYELLNLDIDGQIISLSNYSNRNFGTNQNNDARPITNSTINYSLMGDFATYDAQVSQLYTNNNLVISGISKVRNNNKSYLVFTASQTPQEKYKDLTFTYNSKNYSFKYDGNSKDFYFLVDDSESSNISNIKYNNQKVQFNGTISNITFRSITTTNANVNSARINDNNLSVSTDSNVFTNTDKVLITIKPDINTYTSDLTISAHSISGNSLTINDIKSKLNHSFTKYWVTSIFNVNTGQEYYASENLTSFDLTVPTLSASISNIQFVAKDINTNTFEGSINLNIQNDQIGQLKDKYIKLSFLDKSQRDIAVPDSEYEKQTYGTRGNAFDYMERNLRPENNRYLYLTFNELKSFEFKHLTEGMNWVLHKVEIVNKHNLQTVLDIPLNNVSKHGLETLTTKLEVNNLTLNSGFPNNFTNTNNQSNTSNNNITKQELDNRIENDDTNLTIDWNYHNYKELNKHYLSSTQKLFDLYNDYSTMALKEEVKKFTFNNKSYNWGVVIENFDQKFYEHNDKNTYKIKKSLTNFNNLTPEKDAIINFNFFANPQNTNMDYWYLNQNAYAVSFSLDYLKSQPNQTIDNLEINFVKLWDEIYKGHNSKIEKNDLSINELDIQELEKLMNQRIKVKVYIENNELVFELKARNGVINDQIYLHNLSQEISTYIERAYNYLSIMYVENQNESNKLTYENKNIDTNKLKIDGFLFDANSNFVPKNKYPLLQNEKFNIEVSTWRTKSNSLFNNEIFKKVIDRSIGINYGTGWMISKVKPNDPNDYKYYFGTNRHVPTYGPMSLSAPKDHDSPTDTSLYFSSFGQWNVHTRFKWEASQGNKRIDGTEVLANPLPRHGSNAKLRSSADLQIVEIDIKEVVDYYNTHKNGNPTDAKFKSAEHIANWLNLKDIKVSNKGKYIKKDQFFTAYTSSFPGSTTGTSKRNIQMRHNYLSSFAWDDFGQYGYGRSDQIYFRGSFLDTDIEAYHQFQGGSSGTGLYDDEGNFLSIHAGKVGDGGNGSYLLNSQRMNFMGDLNDYNDKSFAYMIQRRHRLWPKQYDMLNIFNEFIKPFEK